MQCCLMADVENLYFYQTGTICYITYCYNLAFTTLWAISANKLMIFVLISPFLENRRWHFMLIFAVAASFLLYQENRF